MDILTLSNAIVGLVAVTGAGAVIMIATGERKPDGRCTRAGGLVLALFLAGCAIATITWEELALQHFAKEADAPTRGLIGGPTGGVDHQFTPRGKHYYRWIFEIPIVTGLAALTLSLLVGSGTLYAAGYRRVLIGVTLWAFAMAAAVILSTLVRFFHAFEVFI